MLHAHEWSDHGEDEAGWHLGEPAATAVAYLGSCCWDLLLCAASTGSRQMLSVGGGEDVGKCLGSVLPSDP